jgi:hypothetical protein
VGVAGVGGEGDGLVGGLGGSARGNGGGRGSRGGRGTRGGGRGRGRGRGRKRVDEEEAAFGAEEQVGVLQSLVCVCVCVCCVCVSHIMIIKITSSLKEPVGVRVCVVVCLCGVNVAFAPWLRCTHVL